ncbi:MAG: hypothetical protein D3910_15540 [Candidatus Electrothrix sp. ATG2]|nr:hypothetical protein [Candidatus Electrothrix sp. ATG2]
MYKRFQYLDFPFSVAYFPVYTQELFLIFKSGGVAPHDSGGEFGGKAALLALVSKDLTGRIKAGQLVKEVASLVGGKGGGRPDMAQAGGPLADKLPEAIQAVPGIVGSLLGE